MSGISQGAGTNRFRLSLRRGEYPEGGRGARSDCADCRGMTPRHPPMRGASRGAGTNRFHLSLRRGEYPEGGRGARSDCADCCRGMTRGQWNSIRSVADGAGDRDWLDHPVGVA
jgi:hypothetical protein